MWDIGRLDEEADRLVEKYCPQAKS
jgi:hypothetical protein